MKKIVENESDISFMDNSLFLIEHDIDLQNKRIYVFGSSNALSLGIADLDTIAKGIKILDAINDKRPIEFILSTSGGEDEIGVAIYDMIRACLCKTRIICVGKCYSMGTVILQAADERFSLFNTRFMIHEGSFDSDGSTAYADVKDEMVEMKRLLDFMYTAYSERTNFSTKQLKLMLRRKDFYFDAEEALNHGFIDKIIKTY